MHVMKMAFGSIYSIRVMPLFKVITH